jgi:hypothetical protein
MRAAPPSSRSRKRIIRRKLARRPIVGKEDRRADQVAIIWEGDDPTHGEKITYRRNRRAGTAPR